MAPPATPTALALPPSSDGAAQNPARLKSAARHRTGPPQAIRTMFEEGLPINWALVKRAVFSVAFKVWQEDRRNCFHAVGVGIALFSGDDIRQSQQTEKTLYPGIGCGADGCIP